MPADAVLSGIDNVLGKAAVRPEEVDLVLHGTTLARNCLPSGSVPLMEISVRYWNFRAAEASAIRRIATPNSLPAIVRKAWLQPVRMTYPLEYLHRNPLTIIKQKRRSKWETNNTPKSCLTQISRERG
jgi:hypothetical protein